MSVVTFAAELAASLRLVEPTAAAVVGSMIVVEPAIPPLPFSVTFQSPTTRYDSAAAVLGAPAFVWTRNVQFPSSNVIGPGVSTIQPLPLGVVEGEPEAVCVVVKS